MPDGLRLFLLGGFRVEVDGAPVASETWTRQTARTLVKLLAITRGHRLHRDEVLETLWPDQPADAALNALRKALHDARQTLEPARKGHGARSLLRIDARQHRVQT